jgi:hypothetical protein
MIEKKPSNKTKKKTSAHQIGKTSTPGRGVLGETPCGGCAFGAVCVTTTRADGREAWMDERRHATSEAAS